MRCFWTAKISKAYFIFLAHCFICFFIAMSFATFTTFLAVAVLFILAFTFTLIFAFSFFCLSCYFFCLSYCGLSSHDLHRSEEMLLDRPCIRNQLQCIHRSVQRTHRSLSRLRLCHCDPYHCG